MKKLIALMILCCLFTACAAAPEAAPAETTMAETAAVTVAPLPVTLDPNQLDNCTVAVSLQEGDAYVDDTGAMQMKVTVYTYDLYDMADIARLKSGDLLIIGQKEVTVTSVEESGYGSVLINGGLDAGGYELCTDENTVYYETGYSDVKSWYPLGDTTIPVSPDFQYTDRSDLDRDPIIYYPGDFLIPGTGIDYNFTPHNTTITIENGKIIAMYRIYTP